MVDCKLILGRCTGRFPNLSGAAGEFIQEHQRLLATRLAPESRDITERRGGTQADLEELYRRVISYLLLSSGVGSPNDVNTVREATGIGLTR